MFSIDAVDAHAEGQHGRVVIGGIGRLAAPGATLFEKMKHFEQRADWLRKLMLREPRGYPQSCVNVVVPPVDPTADAAFIIMEQPDYYASMSGSNTLVVTTVLLETGLLPMVEPVTELRLEVPAGTITVTAECAGGRVRLVEFANVPSFALHLDAEIEVAGHGRIPVDVAFGGMVYVIVDAARLGVPLDPSAGADLQRAAFAVLDAARAALPVRHPANPEIKLIEGVLLAGPPRDPSNHARNAVVLSSGQMDRCPCGTGTAARMAALHAKGQLRLGEPFRHEGLLDTVFRGRIVEETSIGGVPAIVPAIAGRAWITGYARYVLADDDPFPEGLMVGDIWPMANLGSVSARLSAVRRDDR